MSGEDPAPFPPLLQLLGFQQLLGICLCPFSLHRSWRSKLAAHLSSGTPRVLVLRAAGPRLPVAQAHSCNLNEQRAKPLKTQLGLSFYCRREEMQS